MSGRLLTVSEMKADPREKPLCEKPVHGECVPHFSALVADTAIMNEPMRNFRYLRHAGITDMHLFDRVVGIGEEVVKRLSHVAHEYADHPESMLDDPRYRLLEELAELPDMTGPYYTPAEMVRLLQAEVLFDPVTGLPLGQTLLPQQADEVIARAYRPHADAEQVVALVRRKCPHTNHFHPLSRIHPMRLAQLGLADDEVVRDMQPADPLTETVSLRSSLDGSEQAVVVAPTESVCDLIR